MKPTVFSQNHPVWVLLVDLIGLHFLPISFRWCLYQGFNISRFDEGDFFSFPLACVIYLAFLFRKSQRFLIPSLLAHHMSYLQLYHFLPCLKTGVNYRGNNACIILICMQRSSIFKLFYCIEIYLKIIFLVACLLQELIRSASWTKEEKDWGLSSTVVKWVKLRKLSIRLTEILWNKTYLCLEDNRTSFCRISLKSKTKDERR